MSGDWDDVDAAVEIGADQAECAVASQTTESDGVRRYSLKHIRGSTISLVVRRVGEQEIQLEATARPARNAALEYRVLERTRIRLSDLRGVEVAPIRPTE